MHLTFGLTLDSLHQPVQSAAQHGKLTLGPLGLLAQLELRLGIFSIPEEERTREEMYRIAIKSTGLENPFYKKSFEADSIGTASRLLKIRDELVLSGWDFSIGDNTPDRLKALAMIENHNPDFRKTHGFADRYVQILNALPSREIPIETIDIQDPKHLLPGYFQKLFLKLEDTGIKIIQKEYLSNVANTDLGLVQEYLLTKKASSGKAIGDGSLLILNSESDVESARFMSKWISDKKEKPLFIIPPQNTLTDLIFTNEGNPPMGIRYKSPHHALLQLLKLAPSFLWEPLDVGKVLAFLTLPEKPINRDLAYRLAKCIHTTPGTGGPLWEATIQEVKDKINVGNALEISAKQQIIKKIEAQVEFWFHRKRYASEIGAPVNEVIGVFQYLVEHVPFRPGSSETIYHAFRGNCSNIITQLQLLNENEFVTELAINKMVEKEIGAEASLFEEAAGSAPYVHLPGNIIEPVEEIVWMEFTDQFDHQFARGYFTKLETDYMSDQKIELEDPKQAVLLSHFYNSLPFFNAKKLILVIPKQVMGEKTDACGMYDFVNDGLENIADITVDLKDHEKLQKLLYTSDSIPKQKEAVLIPLPEMKSTWNISALETYSFRGQESFTSLQHLFYYPHQYMLGYVCQLRKEKIMTVQYTDQFHGIVVHKLFEKFLLRLQNNEKVGEEDIEKWFDVGFNKFLSQEASLFLMKGMEKERSDLKSRAKEGIKYFVNNLEKNQWKIVGVETELTGTVAGIEINGRTDILLENNKGLKAVIDLKSGGLKNKKESIQMDEDIQLMLYSFLAGEGRSWPETAYFIFSTKRFLSRNRNIFPDALIACREEKDCHISYASMLSKLKETYKFRVEQFKQGKVDVCLTETLDALEPLPDNCFLPAKASDKYSVFTTFTSPF